METLESRPGGVYRDERIKALYAAAEIPSAASDRNWLTESLAVIAEEVSRRSLYAMQAIVLLATIVSVVVLSSTDVWMVVAAAGLACAFLALAALAGFYLIAVKDGAAGAGS
jgi:hypothetical protein